jgi:hypothetical protein
MDHEDSADREIKRQLLLFQKHCKAADRLQKLLSAVVALYATRRHNDDCIHQIYELDHSIAPKIQFNLRGFSDQFKPFPIEPASYRHENTIRGDHPAISLNVGRPSTQKPQKIPASIFLGVIQSMFASYMETVSVDAKVSEPTDGGTKSAPESRVEPNLRRVKLSIGHLIIWGFMSGLSVFWRDRKLELSSRARTRVMVSKVGAARRCDSVTAAQELGDQASMN